MHARQCYKYLIEFFPDRAEVRNGDIAIALADNYAITVEVDTACMALDAAIARLPGRNSPRATELENKKNELRTRFDAFHKSYDEKK